MAEPALQLIRCHASCDHDTLHKRYGRDGVYDETSDEALMAHRVRGFLRSSPVLLLTATPMQNSLAELWGLVQYVEPTGTLLADITTFRKVFCSEDDKTLVQGQEHELQRRLAVVLQRTLRRQAQEFLDHPFTQRPFPDYSYETHGMTRNFSAKNGESTDKRFILTKLSIPVTETRRPRRSRASASRR